MRIFRTTYRTRDGRTKQARRWYVEVRDHLQTVRRFPAFEDKGQSRAFGAKIEKLISVRRSGDSLDEDLIAWLKLQPPKLLKRLNDIGVIDGRLIGILKPLSEHLAEYRLNLQAKGDTPQQVKQVMARIRHVFREGKCQRWSDITATQVEKALLRLQAERGVSKRTAHGYLQALRQFVAWMLASGRALDSPIRGLEVKVKETDIKRPRRALTIEEVVKLLVATKNSTRPAKMYGLARSLVYRLAIESGMRRGDFKHLRVGSFDFEQRTVSIMQGSKNGKIKTLPIRADTAKELQEYMASKLPGASAFDMPDRTSDMIRRDLEEARVPYVNAMGQYADFHSLRHTSGTWLAFSGAHPNVIKDVLRHSDIRLTMDRYGHLFDGQSRQAVEALPNLTEAIEKATGTDGTTPSVLASCLALSDAKPCTTMHSTAKQEALAEVQGGQQKSPSRGQKPRCRAGTGEGGIRTRGRGVYPYDGLANRSVKTRKALDTQNLRTSQKDDLASFLAPIVKDHPELSKLIEAWPDLALELRAAILKMIFT